MTRVMLLIVALAAAAGLAASTDRPQRGLERGGQIALGSVAEIGAARIEAARDTVPVVVTFTAGEYAFGAPPTVPAGLVTLRLDNRGKEPHHMQLFKLEDGKSFKDFAEAMHAAQPGTPLPKWIRRAGGPGGVMPGNQSNATQTLDAGSFAAVCFVSAPDGMPHFLKGMMQPLEIATVEDAAEGDEPRSDLTLHLSEYDFHFTKPVTAGEHTIRVEAAGKQPHDVQIWRLGPGQTVADFTAWLEGGEQGPPPGEGWIGGVSGLEAGDHALITATFEPGNYALICFEADEGDRRPHFLHGMVKQLTVS